MSRFGFLRRRSFFWNGWRCGSGGGSFKSCRRRIFFGRFSGRFFASGLRGLLRGGFFGFGCFGWRAGGFGLFRFRWSGGGAFCFGRCFVWRGGTFVRECCRRFGGFASRGLSANTHSCGFSTFTFRCRFARWRTFARRTCRWRGWFTRFGTLFCRICRRERLLLEVYSFSVLLLGFLVA